MAAVIVCGTFSQMALIRAFSLGEAAMLDPYIYVGLIFAAIWSVVFFAPIG